MSNPRHDAIDAINKKYSNQGEDQPHKEEVVEDNVVENKEEVLENIEKTTTVEETEVNKTTEQPTTLTDDSVFSYLSEKLDRKVETLDDLVIKEEVVKEVEKEYFSNDAKGLDQYLKDTGRTLHDYVMLNRDLESLSKEQVIKESLKSDNPKLSESQLNRLYKRRFGIDQDLMDEEQIEDINLDIDIAYNKGLDSLKKQKETYLIPAENSTASVEARNKEEQAKIEQANQLWVETVAKENSQLSGIEIDLGEDFKFTHPITDEKKSNVKEIAQDPSLQKFYGRYLREDGSYDAKKYQRDIYILENLPAILNDVKGHAQATTIETIDKEDKNIDFKSDQKAQPKKEMSKRAEQAYDLYKARYNKR